MTDPNQLQEDDPRELLSILIERGEGNTPDAIMLRLLWLRQDHPQAAVSTNAIHVEDDRVVIQAAILLPQGAAGSGIAAARVDDGDDWADVVERTETIAISRALDTLGYVLRAATAPTAQTHQRAEPQPQTRDIRQEESAPPRVPSPSGPSPESAPAPQQATPPRVDGSAPSVVNALRRANRPVASQPSTSTDTPKSVLAEDDVHLEEYSWNTFWSRAREMGLTPDKVTEALGKPANQMSPKEAVSGLIAAGAWPQSDDE